VNVPVRFVARRLWWRRFHPITRFGWNLATMGRTRPVSQTIVGLGLMGAGIVVTRRRRRIKIYSGTIEPGSGIHIKVHRGNEAIYDGPLTSNGQG
jgi:LPXTG-motif cell wall-anchored protein